MIFKKKYFYYFFLFLLPARLFPQNAPVTSAATIANVNPGLFSVPVTVTGFTNIGAISLTLDYNYSSIHFTQAVTNPAIGWITTVDVDLGTGFHRITMGWYGPGKTLPAGSTLITLKFTYLTGSTALTWYDDGSSCEYADGSNNVLNDIPTASYYINGYICGSMGSPGAITGSTTVCQQTSQVIYSVENVVNATSYSWTVPPGATITSGNSSNIISVDYGAAASSGTVSVQVANACAPGASSSLPVTVNQKPVANAGNDQTIPYGTSTTLNGSSSTPGSFSYHWRPENLLVNPNLQNTPTVNLSNSTIFTLVVTSTTSSCNDSDEVVVNITGGPLSANPYAYPNHICVGQSAQLFANPGGGSGNYTYTWTSDPQGTPPWTSSLPDPLVSPVVSTIYHLTVHDGFNSVQSSVELAVFPLPSGSLTGGDTLCGEEDSARIQINLSGEPPWNFIFGNGNSSVSVSNQQSTPYIGYVSESGTWQLLLLNDKNCVGNTNGSALIMAYPAPETPVINLNGNMLVSSACCGNQWYLNNVAIPGAVSQNFLPAMTGNYFSIVTQNTCVSEPSNVLYIIVDGILEKNNSVQIYPNPVKDFLNIEINEDGYHSFRIFDCGGKLIKDFTLQGQKERVDLRDLPPGYYIGNLNNIMIPVIKM